jgi:hypothetical protein
MQPCGGGCGDAPLSELAVQKPGPLEKISPFLVCLDREGITSKRIDGSISREETTMKKPLNFLSLLLGLGALGMFVMAGVLNVGIG